MAVPAQSAPQIGPTHMLAKLNALVSVLHLMSARPVATAASAA